MPYTITIYETGGPEVLSRLAMESPKSLWETG